ncbi:PAS domain S-box-containing protein [Kaistia soli DSM 19436]|uniref:histidine kinase n=1 Tax=Kaistia soli DSM 19436 TaxID=1122133 RepID=A0A1M5L6J9_9HYPH|nr:PAS domain-containing sensor histidine kinase [Kaistia soli]SHG60570.1 PAS domain S-box-containing protein [Kaistia soli DSM 19436]
MDDLKSAKPVIFAVALLVTLFISACAFLLFEGGILSLFFLAITSALLGGSIHSYYRERLLRKTERGFVENIPGLGWTSDGGGRIRSMNSRMREFLQVPRGSLVVSPESIHPEDKYKTLDLWGQQHRSEKRGTHRLLGPDGRYHWFRSAVHPILDQSGVVVSSWGTFIDISDLKAAEDALRSSEENLRTILDHIPENIVIADSNGENEYSNQHSMIFYGSMFHEVNGSGYHKFIHPDDVDEYVADTLFCIENAVPMNRLVRQRRYDGVYRWFRMRVNPAFDENGKVVRWYGLHIDIDDEVKAMAALQDAKDKLAQASEYASLAELAASIAHEVNQPLAAVVTNSEACQLWLSAESLNLDRARTNVSRIVRDAKGAADIVSRIRELFAKKAPHKEAADINNLLNEMIGLILKKYSDKRLSISMDLDEHIPLIELDRVQIQQLMFNILRNGVEAMRENGEVPMRLDISSRVAGDAAIVRVADNGIGLADSRKVFEPFFTTKSDGMGMGLSICRTIVDAHSGRLWAEANPSRGAVFAFELPIHDAISLGDIGRRGSRDQPDV